MKWKNGWFRKLVSLPLIAALCLGQTAVVFASTHQTQETDSDQNGTAPFGGSDSPEQNHTFTVQNENLLPSANKKLQPDQEQGNALYLTKKTEATPDEILVKVNKLNAVSKTQTNFAGMQFATQIASVQDSLSSVIKNVPELRNHVHSIKPVFAHVSQSASTVPSRAMAAGLPAANIKMNQTKAELAKWSLLKVDPAKRDQVMAKLNKTAGVSAYPNFKVQVLTTDLPTVSYEIPDDHYLKDGTQFREAGWNQQYPDLWGLRNMKVLEAWDKFKTDIDEEKDSNKLNPAVLPLAGEGVVVAVVDTGVDYNHPDIQENIYVNPNEIASNGIDDDGNGFVDDIHGWNFNAGNNDPMDRHGHGTHVAGTIAAVANNGIGIVGIAPKAKILPVKGLGDEGSGSWSDLAPAIVYAVDMGAQVINNSLGCNNGCPSNPIAEDAVDYAHELGVTVVFAAGNDTNNTLYYSPQNTGKVITVSAFDPDDQMASFSNYGPTIDVAAPGGGKAIDPNVALSPHSNILSLKSSDNKFDSGLIVGSDYIRLGGTSMASPHAAGAAALIISYNRLVRDRALRPEEVREILKASADDILDPKGDGSNMVGRDPFSGHGRVNAQRALGIEEVSTIELISPKNYMTLPSGELTRLRFKIMPATVHHTITHITLEETWTTFQTKIWTPLKNISWDPVTGILEGDLDPSTLGMGQHNVRVRFDDGDRSYVKIYSFLIDNIRYISPDGSALTYDQALLCHDPATGNNICSEGIIPIQIELLGDDWNNTDLTVTLREKNFDSPTSSRELYKGPAQGPQVMILPFDSTQEPDDIYFVLLQIDVKGPAEATYTEYRGYFFRVDNGYFIDPLPGNLYRSLDPITVRAHTSLPNGKIEAGVGPNPANWITIGTTSGGNADETVLNPNLLIAGGNDLITLRLTNEINGQTYERERMYLTFNTEIDAPWPVISNETIYQATSLTIGDMNGDAADELLFGTFQSQFDAHFSEVIWRVFPQEPSLFVLNGDGTFNQNIRAGAKNVSPTGVTGITLANLDGEKGEEVIIGNSNRTSSANTLYALDPNGNVLTGWNAPVYPALNLLSAPVAKNIDQLGPPEIITTLSKFDRRINNMVGKEILTLRGSDGTLRDRWTMDWQEIDHPVNIVADLDGDGTDELIVNDYDDTNGIQLLILDANTLTEKMGRIPLMPADPIAPHYPKRVGVGDLDGDEHGDLEIIALISGAPVSDRGKSLVLPKLFAYHHTGEMVSGFPYAGDFPPETGASHTAINEFGPVVDMNGDGRTEMIVLEQNWVWTHPTDENIKDADRQYQLNVISWENGTVHRAPGWPAESLQYTKEERNGVETTSGNDFSYDESDVLQAVIGNMDNDPAMDIAISAQLVNRKNIKDMLEQGNAHAILVYNLETGNATLPPMWIRGDLNVSLALGNTNAGSKMQLIAAGNMFFFDPDPANWGPRREISVFDLENAYSPDQILWGQERANPQKTGVDNKNRAPTLVIAPPRLDFGSDPNIEILSFRISNTGPGNIDYTLEENLSWLSLSSTSGSVSNEVDTIYVTIDRNLLHAHSASPQNPITEHINVSDGTNIKQLTITAVPQNEPPAAQNDSKVIDENAVDAVINVLANDSDPDSDTLFIDSITQAPAHGNAAIEVGKIRYAPVRNFTGNDVFIYRISDGHGGSATATVSIMVTPDIEPPTVTVTEPQNNFTATNESINVKGIVSEPVSNVIIFVNNSAAKRIDDLTGLDFEASISIPNGANTFFAIAHDLAGNEGRSSTFQFTGNAPRDTGPASTKGTRSTANGVPVAGGGFLLLPQNQTDQETQVTIEGTTGRDGNGMETIIKPPRPTETLQTAPSPISPPARLQFTDLGPNQVFVYATGKRTARTAAPADFELNPIVLKVKTDVTPATELEKESSMPGNQGMETRRERISVKETSKSWIERIRYWLRFILGFLK